MYELLTARGKIFVKWDYCGLTQCFVPNNINSCTNVANNFRLNVFPLRQTYDTHCVVAVSRITSRARQSRHKFVYMHSQVRISFGQNSMMVLSVIVWNRLVKIYLVVTYNLTDADRLDHANAVPVSNLCWTPLHTNWYNGTHQRHTIVNIYGHQSPNKRLFLRCKPQRYNVELHKA